MLVATDGPDLLGVCADEFVDRPRLVESTGRPVVDGVQHGTRHAAVGDLQ
jgi:hypothetical protein